MKLYEINCLIPQSGSEEEISKIALGIESSIQDQGGILAQERKKQEVKLAQPIAETKNALLFTFRFQVAPRKINSIKEAVKKNTRIIRVSVEKASKSPLLKIRKKEKKRVSGKKEGRVKVELNKIEEKLDQILNES